MRRTTSSDALSVKIHAGVSAVGDWKNQNKKLSYCWETVRRESMQRIAEIDVEMTA